MPLQVPSESLNLQLNPFLLINHASLEINHCLLLLIREKTSLLGGPVMHDTFPHLNLIILPQSSESHPFPIHAFPVQGIPVGGRLAHILEHWVVINQKEWVLYIIQKVLRIPFGTPFPLLTVPIILSQSSISLNRRKVIKFL